MNKTTKTLRDHHEVILEALCLHEVFRRLGFSSEQIFVQLACTADPNRLVFFDRAKTGDLCVHVVLRAQGLEYTGGIGPLPVAEDDWEQTWTDATVAWNAAPEAEMKKIWERSRVLKTSFNVMMALQAKGFRIPSLAASCESN